MTDGPDPPETPPRREKDPYAGGAMMAIGGLMATLCGACTLLFVGNSLNNMSGLVFALIVGGVPALFGALLFRAGLRLFRGGPP